MINKRKLKQIANKSFWEEKAKSRLEKPHLRKLATKVSVLVLISMERNKINKEELSKRTGFPISKIEKIMRSDTTLTLEDIAKLEKALDLKIIK